MSTNNLINFPLTVKWDWAVRESRRIYEESCRIVNLYEREKSRKDLSGQQPLLRGRVHGERPSDKNGHYEDGERR